MSPEKFSMVIAAIHAAGASPERWPEAVLAAARLLEPQEEDALALASLDRLGLAAFVADGAGHLCDLNASARRMLEKGRCIRVSRSALRLESPAWNAAFEEALRAATRAPARSSLLPLSAGIADACEVAVSPLATHWSDPALEAPALALVVVAPPRRDDAMLAHVRCLYGLTEAEARVMAALTSGATVDEIARRHGVRACTVRAQVRSLFEKTGVNRQSDLVRLALTGRTPRAAVADARYGV